MVEGGGSQTGGGRKIKIEASRMLIAEQQYSQEGRNGTSSDGNDFHFGSL